jgi:hypothetical protein
MAADNLNTWRVLDGNGTTLWIVNATIDEYENMTPQFAPRTNGGPVEVTNPLPVYIPAGSTIPAQLPGTAGTDHSNAQPELLSVLETIAPNASRVGFWWQNQSAATIQIVIDHDTTGENYSVILSASGAAPGSGLANVQGDSSSLGALGIRHTGQIRICGAEGSQFAAAEF